MPNLTFGSETAAAVLRAVYRAARGRYARSVALEQVAEQLDISLDELGSVAEGLKASGYARETGDPLTVALEHAGLDWVEVDASFGDGELELQPQ